AHAAYAWEAGYSAHLQTSSEVRYTYPYMVYTLRSGLRQWEPSRGNLPPREGRACTGRAKAARASGGLVPKGIDARPQRIDDGSWAGRLDDRLTTGPRPRAGP